MRWQSLCVYIENFLTNQLVKEFWKSVHICWSYYQTFRGILFWNTVYIKQCRELDLGTNASTDLGIPLTDLTAVFSVWYTEIIRPTWDEFLFAIGESVMPLCCISWSLVQSDSVLLNLCPLLPPFPGSLVGLGIGSTVFGILRKNEKQIMTDISRALLATLEALG